MSFKKEIQMWQKQKISFASRSGCITLLFSALNLTSSACMQSLLPDNYVQIQMQTETRQQKQQQKLSSLLLSAQLAQLC